MSLRKIHALGYDVKLNKPGRVFKVCGLALEKSVITNINLLSFQQFILYHLGVLGAFHVSEGTWSLALFQSKMQQNRHVGVPLEKLRIRCSCT